MPIAPDRVKNKIAGMVFAKMRTPLQGELMAQENAKNRAAMSEYEPGEGDEESEDSGKLALMAMHAALQAQDYESAFEALKAAVACCK